MRLICSFPSHQDMDSLVLLVQNPTSLYAYWRLSDRKQSLVAEHFGKSWDRLNPALRLYETGDSFFDGSKAQSVRQYNVDVIESCYLQELEPGRTYAADLGVRNTLGQFIPLIRSNMVQTPGDMEGVNNPKACYLNNTPLKILLPNEYDRFSAYTVY